MVYAVVFAGGAFGALTRYLLSMAITARFGGKLPRATFVVNLTGCFVLGIMLQLTRAGHTSSLLDSFVMIGILGSFTTFSTFSVEALALFERGQNMYAALYIATSVLIGLSALIAGVLLGIALT